MGDIASSFPKLVPDLKIKADPNNLVHGPHFDVLQSIPNGTDQVRVSKDGDVLDSTTNIGKTKMNWP